MKKIYILLVCCMVFVQCFAQITDSVSFSLPQIEIAYQGEYATLSFEGCHWIEEVGAPQLPYLKLHYLLPLNQRVSHIALYDTLFVSKNLNATVYPAQPPGIIGATPPEFVEPNPLLYNTTSPNATIEVAGHNFMKGYQIVTINLYPVQYTGATNIMRLATSMKFTLYLENSESPFIRPKMQSVAITALIKKQIQALVRNGEQIDEVLGGPLSVGDALTSSPSFNLPIDKRVQNQIPQYLIITNNTDLNGNAIPPYNGKTMTQIFQELADWKTQKGIPGLLKFLIFAALLSVTFAIALCTENQQNFNSRALS